MPATIEACDLIFRQWNAATGLTEHTASFRSLDELYALCLATVDPTLIDRIILRGHDELGEPQTVTFEFQSITVRGQLARPERKV